jgi:hypothetical protein
MLQKDLVRRLRTVAEVFQHNTIEPDSQEYPALDALASCLVNNYLDHKDKDVRLYAVVICMEIFEAVSCCTVALRFTS